MIYTSYFSLTKIVKNPIAICGGIPDWYIGKWTKILAPKWLFFHDYKQGIIDEHGYTLAFNEQVLSKLNPVDTYNYLMNMFPGDPDVTLLCFEKPNEFCHRHLVAKWFNDANLPCEEFKHEKKSIDILGDMI